MMRLKACDLNVKVQYCKHSDFQVGRDYISRDRKLFSHVNLDLKPRTQEVELAQDTVISTNV